MSTEDKLASAIALIEQYNSQVEKEDRINQEEFTRRLKKLGGTTEELLSELRWEDIEKCGVPVLLARKIANNIFRTVSKAPEDPKYVSEKAAQRMPPLFLIQSYNAQDPNNSVAKRLRELGRGYKFIVFKGESNDVNVDVSIRLLGEIMKGYPGRETVDVDGRPTRVFSVGESRGETVDENPLYPGRALRPDGTCDQINRSWDGVSLIVRQLLYLAVSQTGEIKLSYDKAHEMRDLAENEDAESRFRTRYPKASTLLDELDDASNTPKLRVKIGGTVKKNDPFFGRHIQY